MMVPDKKEPFRHGIKNCSVFKYEYEDGHGHFTYLIVWQPDFLQLVKND